MREDLSFDPSSSDQDRVTATNSPQIQESDKILHNNLMQSGETFRKLNNFTDVPLVSDDGLVTKELAVHFFIDIFFSCPGQLNR